MKKLLAISLIGTSLIIGSNPAKADWDFYETQYRFEGGNVYYDLFTYDSSTQQQELRTTWSDLTSLAATFEEFDAVTNVLSFLGSQDLDNNGSSETTVFRTYDLDTNQTTDICTGTNGTCASRQRSSLRKNSDGDIVVGENSEINLSTNSSSISTNTSNISSNDTDIASNASNISSNDTDISGLQSLISTKSGSTTTARIGDSTKNILEIGPTTNPTTINQSGISVSGGNLIKKDSDGNIHIGKNSFVIGNEVLNGAHPIWAEDENGSKIPLNIYGSDLQINGVSVQGQIDANKSNIKNLGSGIAGSTALTAALTALPQTSELSKHSCGIGSGAYSSRYAIGFGCASKVNERVDINAGGSYVFGGSKSYGGGTLDSGVVKAGFVFKLGELNKPTQISLEESKELKKEVKDLKAKNDEIISQNQKLLARLEKLENIALNFQSYSDVISMSK